MSINGPVTRRQALRAGALGVTGLYVAACGSSSTTQSTASKASSAASSGNSPVTLNWETWNDHYLPAQIAAVKKSTGIAARPSLESDDSDGYLKVKQAGGQYDIVSTDALWAPKFFHDGLTEAFDIESIPVSSQLYSIAKDVPFWKAGGGYLVYPNGWSSVNIYYNPKYVSPAPTSWEVLTEAKYAGKVVAENQPTDLMAMAGLATGAKQPYGMTTAEISRAQDFLKSAKPAFLKLVSQNSDSVRALADGSAWMALENLGTDFRVKAAGGPLVKEATPKEGVVGWIDGEQMVKASQHKDRFNQFLNGMEQAPWVAQNFLVNGRPLFNEKAYKLLVNQGHKERADLLWYNQPEKALQMTLKGPSGNVQAYIDAFNQVFGA
ncbi:MAG TPA: ABC transporter substrate-binding protein [Solirubrobacteraceae bacterium]|nr:ABC transporter substrate-binding protein [Solirubrobacteraceae bacterium]